MAHKILAIDDHPETLSILVATLKGHGYRVVFSRSPFKGLELAAQEKPDLLMVDMNMPEMNGIEVVRRVRLMPQGDKLPIIMFTAETDSSIKMAGFKAGVDDYIMKPTDPTELIERVALLLEHVPDSDPDDQDRGVLSRDNSSGQPSSAKAQVGQLIALCGVRGGVGTTTIAINLAHILALTKQPTTLVDFDLRQGHIGLYLNQRIGRGLNEAARVPDAQLPQQVLQNRVAYRQNLHLLLTRPNLNGRHPIPNTSQITTILETLFQADQTVVADLGLAVTETTRAIQDRADHLILCLPPERVALAAAKLYLEEMKASTFSHTSLHVLVCDMQMGVSLPQQSIEKYLHCSLLGMLPLPYEELVMASNKGVALAQAFPKSPTLAALYKMSLKLVPASN